MNIYPRGSRRFTSSQGNVVAGSGFGMRHVGLASEE